MDKILYSLAAVLIAGGLVTTAVAIDIPGTDSSDITKDRYDYNARVTVGVKDIAGDPIINEDTFSTCIKRNPFSLSFGSVPGDLSLTSVSGNEVTWKLSGGNLDTPKTKKDDLGTIARIGGKKISDVKYSNLNPGTYTQEVTVVNNDGSTSYSTEVVVGKSSSVSSCGGFLG